MIKHSFFTCFLRAVSLFPFNFACLFLLQGGAISCDDSESECSGVGAGNGVSRSSIKSKSAKRRSSLLEALLLSPSSARRNSKVDSGSSERMMSSSADTQLQVPYVVSACCRHLEAHGKMRSTTSSFLI